MTQVNTDMIVREHGYEWDVAWFPFTQHVFLHLKMQEGEGQTNEGGDNATYPGELSYVKLN